jgi:peroxiredoxin
MKTRARSGQSPDRTVAGRGIAAGLALGFWAALGPALIIAADPTPSVAPSATEAATAPPRDVGRLLIEVPTAGSMQISVVDDEGHPLPQATVHLSQCFSISSNVDESLTKDFVCDATGQATVEIPKSLSYLTLWASSPGRVSLRTEWRPTKHGDPIPEAFTFPLPKPTAIGGGVTDPQGQPIAGVRVEVDHEQVIPGSHSTVVTDAGGRWKLDNVPPGDERWFSVKLTHPDFVSDISWGDMQRQQLVTNELLRAQTATIIMQHGIRLTGTITDHDGKPVPGAVVVWGDYPFVSRRPDEAVRSDEQGRYQLPPLPAGPMTVVVLAKNRMPQMRTVDIGPGIAPADFHLKAGKTLRIRFVDHAGSPVQNVGVEIAFWHGKQRPLYYTQHAGAADIVIPTVARDGIFEWTWAPDDPVTYFVTPQNESAARFLPEQVTLTADDSEQVHVLRPRPRAVGRVIDAKTGRPIERFTVTPSSGDSPWHSRAREFTSKRFNIELEDYDTQLCFEAEGYRTAMSDPFDKGKLVALCDIRLQPAKATTGRVVGPDGMPVDGAKIVLASTKMPVFSPPFSPSLDDDVFVSDAVGKFSFPAQSQGRALIATHKLGYARVILHLADNPRLKLTPWARVEGRLFDAGKPVPHAQVMLESLPSGVFLFDADEEEPRNTDSAMTDATGRFVFDRVTARRYALMAMLDSRHHSRVRSSELVPLDLKPGQHVVQDLGADGAQVRGRIALKGETADDLDLSHSHTLLAPRDPSNQFLESGVPYGPPAGKWRHHYVLELAGDGSFLVSGVPAGEYDLILTPQSPGEHIDFPVKNPGRRQIVPVRVAASDVAAGTLDLGQVELDGPGGPKPGELFPEFDFDTFTGERKKLVQLRGRYVLLAFWVSHCQAYIADVPTLGQLHDQFGDGRLAVVGISFWPNTAAAPFSARQFLKEHPSPWMHGFLADVTNVFTPFGVFMAPTYFLIDPAGKLVSKHYTAIGARKRIETLLDAAGPATAE